MDSLRRTCTYPFDLSFILVAFLCHILTTVWLLSPPVLLLLLIQYEYLHATSTIAQLLLAVGNNHLCYYS
jgi:hypothetical protein